MATVERDYKGMAGSGLNDSDRGWRLVRIIGWSAAALIMLAPLIAMLFTDEVDWGLGDFVLAAIVLGGIGSVFELAIRRNSDNAFRIGMLLALATAFLLIWINAAVGFIGSGANPANILYFAVLAIAASGCIVAGFQPAGMSIAMIATAIAQALVTLLAIAFDWGGGEDRTLLILMINGVFVAMWTGAAMFFHRSAQRRSL